MWISFWRPPFSHQLAPKEQRFRLPSVSQHVPFALSAIDRCDKRQFATLTTYQPLRPRAPGKGKKKKGKGPTKFIQLSVAKQSGRNTRAIRETTPTTGGCKSSNPTQSRHAQRLRV